MNTITIAHFLSYVADILLIILVVGKNPYARANHLCALLVTAFSIWSLFFGLANMAHSQEEAMYFFNVAVIGWSIFPVAALWFYLHLTQNERFLCFRGAIPVSIFIPAFFIYQQWTGNLVNSAFKTTWGWVAVWSHSVYSYIYLAYVILSLTVCMLSIVHYGLHARTRGRKKQANMLLITGCISTILALILGIFNQMRDVQHLPQASDILVLIWAAGIVYTISRYELLTITPTTVAYQILSVMREAIILLDVQGKIIYANRAAASLRKSELQNEYFSSILADSGKASELLREAAINGVCGQQELDYLTTAGSKIPVAVSATAIRESADSIAGFVVSAIDISESKQAHRKIQQSCEMVKKTHHDAVETIARIMDMRDPYTGNHQIRVASLVDAIAREMKLTGEQIDQLHMAAIVHDIGKINIAADILNKPATLSNLEFEIVKAHSQGGYDIVKGLDLPCTIAEAILQHHERLDGSGYPRGLKKAEILLEAKILAVADVIEAMASHRPYRPALGIDRALEEVTSNKGQLYEPAVVDACVRLFNENKFHFA